MNYGVRLLLFVLVACAAFVMLGDEVDAAGDDLALELNDTSSVKVALGWNPITFNLTLTNNGTAASELVVVDVIDIPQNWTNLSLVTSLIVSPPGQPGPPCEVWMDKGETIEVHLVVTPPLNQLNDTYWFTLIAYPRADPAYNVTYDVGIVNPQVAGFHLELHNPPKNNTYQAIPPSTVTIRFAIYNTGNGVDRFLIQGSSSRADVGWTLEIFNGVDEYGYTQEVPPDPLMEKPYYIDVRVPMPAGTEANVEAIVMLNATSVFNVSYQQPPAVATVRALHYFNFQVYINGPDNKEGIPGETVTFEIKINNQGNGPDTFSLEAMSDEALNPGFVAYVVPSKITIERNDNGTALMVVEVPDNPPKKTYFLTVRVRSKSYELSPVTKSFAVEVGQFFGIELTSEDPWRVTDPGGNLEFEVTVRNTGNDLDSIVIQPIEGAPRDWLTYIQPPEITLLQDQTAEIKVIIIVPSGFEYAPKLSYTLTLRAVSARSDAEASQDLVVNITPFNRIEWTYMGKDITNPERLTAQPGSVRPRPEIDLYLTKSVIVVLGIENFGNIPDAVVLDVEVWNDLVEAEIPTSPLIVAPSTIEEVVITIRVPWNMTSGVYTLTVTARSQDPGLPPRSVPLDFLVRSLFPVSDFEGLQYTDPVGDEYTFYQEAQAKDGSWPKSTGRNGLMPGIDIVSLEAFYDQETRMVTVTLMLSGDVVDDEVTHYYVFFVTQNHTQGGPLLEPELYDGKAPFEDSYKGSKGWLVWWEYSDGRARAVHPGDAPGAFPLPPGPMAEVDGNRIVFTTSDEVLRMGVDPGSGFGIYAFAYRAEDGQGWTRITWDSAGMGAAAAPDEFRNEAEDTPMGSYLAPVAIAVAVLSTVALGRRRRVG